MSNQDDNTVSTEPAENDPTSNNEQQHNRGDDDTNVEDDALLNSSFTTNSTSNSSDDTIPPASAIAAPTRPLSPAAPNNQGSRFKIAFSYRSETKDRVSAINDLVHNSLANSECRNPVFYAPNFDEQMAVIDARRILRHIYEEAQMVVVFLSPTYHGSPFTYHEWRTVRNRFMGSAIRNEDKRLLLIKLDEFNARELDLFDDDFFLDAVNFSSEQIADRILQRWNSVS